LLEKLKINYRFSSKSKETKETEEKVRTMELVVKDIPLDIIKNTIRKRFSFFFVQFGFYLLKVHADTLI
jgi:hypothetical protein